MYMCMYMYVYAYAYAYDGCGRRTRGFRVSLDLGFRI
jgi:hypothetical protein